LRDRHTIGMGINTVMRSEIVPEINTPKSSIRVEPHSLAWTTGFIWLRAEKIPWSPHIAIKAVKKPIVHRLIERIQTMATGRNFGMLKTCR
jgi:hypothetical protein